MQVNHQKQDADTIRRTILEPASDITRPIRKGLEQGAAIIQRGREASIDEVETHVEQVNSTVQAVADQLRGQESAPGRRTGDQIEFSERARLLAGAQEKQVGKEDAEEALRRERVEALKLAYEEGRLNTFELAVRSAGKMLGER